MSAPLPIIESVRPFSNGTEGYDWMARNCDRCRVNGPYDPSTGTGPCPMETEVAMGFILGTVSASLATEYGATVRGDYADMPRECAKFVPPATCEHTTKRQLCGAPATTTVVHEGHTRSLCAKCERRYRKDYPASPARGEAVHR